MKPDVINHRKRDDRNMSRRCLRLMSLIVIAFMAFAMFSCGPSQPPGDEIWYTTTDGKAIEVKDICGLGVVSNKYADGKGVIKFWGHVSTIRDWAFYGCENLESITIPRCLRVIDDGAFSGCRNLTSVTISEGTETLVIGCHAFYGSESLSSITIPDGVMTIGDEAFYGCERLPSETKGKIRSINPRAL